MRVKATLFPTRFETFNTALFPISAFRFWRVLKDILNPHAECGGQIEGQRQGRIKPTVFDRYDRVARHADPRGEV